MIRSRSFAVCGNFNEDTHAPSAKRISVLGAVKFCKAVFNAAVLPLITLIIRVGTDSGTHLLSS